MITDILYFPFHDFKKWEKEGFRTRDAHLFREFSKRSDIGKILVINRPTSMYEILLKTNKKNTESGKVVYKEKNFIIKKISNKVYTLDFAPKSIFGPIINRKNWWSITYNSKRFKKIIDFAITFIELDDNFYIYSNVVINFGIVKSVKKQYEKSKLIFDLVDDQSKIASSKSYLNSIKKGYGTYSTISDLLIGTSSSLSEKVNKEIIEVTNGVDLKYFQNPVNSNKINLSSPKVIYTGKIHKRIDFELLKSIITKLQNVNFIFCGPVLGETPFKNMLKENKNLIWLGDVHYDELPGILNEADVCIIPHLNNDLTKSQSPLKLLEYLAANKPIVTTPIKGTEFYKTKNIFIANNSSEFVNGIRHFINNPVNEIFEIPKTELWSSKVDLIIQKLDDKE